MNTQPEQDAVPAIDDLAHPTGRGWIWLVAILLLLGAAKLTFTWYARDKGADGGFYTDVARHVRDGQGLSTNLSLYHKGYHSFPHPTSVYPLWPLVYGYAARAVDIERVSRWLPAIFYLTALLMAFLWGASILPRDLLPVYLPGFNAGHLLVLVLGLHSEFFRFTSMPYTEGLAYTLLFGGLYMVSGAMRRPNLLRGVGLGVWLGALMLTRSQLVIAALAMAPTLALAVAVSRNRLAYLKLAAGVGVGAAAVLAPYIYRCSTFLHNPSLFTALRFDQARVDPALSEIPIMVETEGLTAFLLDRLGGLSEAFALSGRHSYLRVFHAFAYAVPVALVAVVGWAVRRTRLREWPSAIRAVLTPDGFSWTVFVLIALGGALSVHVVHKVYSFPWYFNTRQGLPVVFLIFFSIVLLLRLRVRALRAIGVLLLCAGLYTGGAALFRQVYERATTVQTDQVRWPLVRWIRKTQAERGEFVVAITHLEAERFAYMTDKVGYHWLTTTTTLGDLLYIFDELGADYLMAANKPRWRFMRDSKAFDRAFRRTDHRFGNLWIYERRTERKGKAPGINPNRMRPETPAPRRGQTGLQGRTDSAPRTGKSPG